MIKPKTAEAAGRRRKAMDNLKIGQYIQRLRRSEGLTQKELARKASIRR